MDKKRLDYLVAHKLGISRSVAVRMIEGSKVEVDGRLVTEPDKRFSKEAEITAKEDISGNNDLTQPDIGVLYEDDDCIVINKPVGVLTHSKGVFNPEPTVASWLSAKTRGFDGGNRAGIVHRLDRGTGGVMLCAKNPAALAHFQKQFAKRNVKKTYYALVEGSIDPPQAIIDIPIERNPKDPKRFRTSANGKKAVTRYKVISSFDKDGYEFSLLELSPKTGRTHQLRVHLNHLKHPIVGDDFYGGLAADRLYLHAGCLELTMTDSERRVFTVDLPDSFMQPKILTDG